MDSDSDISQDEYDTDARSDGQTDAGDDNYDPETNVSELQEHENAVPDHEHHATNQETVEGVREGVEEFFAALRRDFDGSANAEQRLFVEYERYVRPQSKKVQKELVISVRNIIYKMATEKDERVKVPLFIGKLVSSHPSLLRELDDYGCGALFHAIDKGIEWLIEAIVGSDISLGELQKVLGPCNAEDENVRRTNCIHRAIDRGLKPSLTIALIRKASVHTLASQDDSSKTPLHHAVEINRCTHDRLQIIRILIELGDGAFDKRTSEPERFSIYRYHINSASKPRTRDRSGNKPRARKNPIAKGAISREFNMVHPPISHSDRNKGLRRQSPSTTDTGRMLENGSSNGAFKMSEYDTVHVSRSQSFYPLDSSISTDFGSPFDDKRHVRRLNPANGLKSHDDASTHALELAKPTESRKISDTPNTETVSIPSLKETAKEVTKLLKLHYLRTTSHRSRDGSTFGTRSDRTPSTAVEFMYGDCIQSMAKDLWFRYPPNIDKKIDGIDFAKFEQSSFKTLRFDSALLFVDFGKLKLADPQDERSLRQRQFAGSGKWDLVKFFDWLWKKNVRNIVKVEVDDSEDLPHCDEAIIECLKNFELEILKWRKPDLCASAIRYATNHSPNFRELHLDWSGNNAVLRSWSETEGLAEIPSLETIHVWEVKKPLDSDVRVRGYFEDFKDRLNKPRARPQITVHRHLFGETSLQDPTASTISTRNSAKTEGNKVNEHLWLNIMDAFAEGICKLVKPPKSHYQPEGEQPYNYLKDPKLSAELTSDVTVALIDDGVDFIHKAFSDKLGEGKTFESGCSTVPEPYYVSTTGHGSFMANMIGRMCPRVKILVYKIEVLEQEQGVKFRAKSVADLQAVDHAIKRGCDIISMSWTVQQNKNDNSDDIERLRDRLREASTKSSTSGQQEILLFCSAPDKGHSNLEDQYFPFDCAGVPQMFKIGAADPDGSISRWVDSRVDYILPGHEVQMKDCDIDIEEDKIPRTGSSVATALAAGLAALIIHCVRLGVIYNHYEYRGLSPSGPSAGVDLDCYRRIKTYKGMKDAFRRIAKEGTHGSSDKRLGVETFFQGKASRLGGMNSSSLADSDADADKKWAQVADIAIELSPKG
ncbi:hypothetical protein BDV96DRAFT_607204 [Lophiotrema nucula]|uniref:Peptidase S8/S53 domain-containing protein n=1 Tax=Lophiotrema nucula TaxID=690887 RepID=A0A6A5YI65_9PLEO|nr:hypothetical protein BDV96DRAFT_607204 [Lophiotrema nucula]